MTNKTNKAIFRFFVMVFLGVQISLLISIYGLLDSIYFFLKLNF